MKKIETWLNEKEFERFLKRAKTYDLTPYALLKAVIQIEISGDPNPQNFCRNFFQISEKDDLFDKMGKS